MVWWSRWHWVGAASSRCGNCACARPRIRCSSLGAVAAGRDCGRALSAWPNTPDLHGSARWANHARGVGDRLPGAARILCRAGCGGWLVRAGLLQAAARRDGIYLALGDLARMHYLRDCGPGHVLVRRRPARQGRQHGGADAAGVAALGPGPRLQGRAWPLTAGARQHMGLALLQVRSDRHRPVPASNTTRSKKCGCARCTKPEDVQNIVQMIWSIPTARGFNRHHWVKAGIALLTGAILHMLYAEPAKTLRGLVGLLSDPECTIMETIERIMTAEHDPDGNDGLARLPRRADAHPSVGGREHARGARQGREGAQRGVFSTVKSCLPLYRDPIVAANTEYSEFRIDDLVNHDQPASLYLVVPMESRDRLRPLTRLIINQIVRTLTAKLEFKDGRAVSPHRHPLLLMLDEFPLLGRLRSIRRGDEPYGRLRLSRLPRGPGFDPDLRSLRAPRDHHQQLRHDRARLRPTTSRPPRKISKLGQTSVRHSHRTVIQRRHAASRSPRWAAADDAGRGAADGREGSADIRARATADPRRAAAVSRAEVFPAPGRNRSARQVSDRIITAPPAEGVREKRGHVDRRAGILADRKAVKQTEPTSAEIRASARAGEDCGIRRYSFSKFAPAAPTCRSEGAPDEACNLAHVQRRSERNSYL